MLESEDIVSGVTVTILQVPSLGTPYLVYKYSEIRHTDMTVDTSWKRSGALCFIRSKLLFRGGFTPRNDVSSLNSVWVCVGMGVYRLGKKQLIPRLLKRKAE